MVATLPLFLSALIASTAASAASHQQPAGAALQRSRRHSQARPAAVPRQGEPNNVQQPKMRKRSQHCKAHRASQSASVASVAAATNGTSSAAGSPAATSSVAAAAEIDGPPATANTISLAAATSSSDIPASAAPTATSTSVAAEAPATSAASEAATSSEIAVNNAVKATTSSPSSAAAAATTTSSVASAATTAGSVSASGFTPNNNKAGIAGGDSYDFLSSKLGWWYDWSASPSGHGDGKNPLAVPMLWGAGSVDGTDSSRLTAFKAISSTPEYIIGFEEPDCAAGSGSADIGISTAASLWNELVAPWGAKGSVLLSPSMCKQADEVWLTPFKQQISREWDITNVHINKNSMAGVTKDIEYYYNKYGKPLWVTEFACVDDSSSFIPCTDQGEINQYISDIVDLFESDSRVAAYAYSDGYGLGDVWPTTKNGKLSASGEAYLAALSRHH